MSIILITILILFLIKLLRDSLSLMWLWQVKEYRIDRMMSHLKEDKKIIQNNPFYILTIILFILYFVFLKNNLLIFQYLVLAFFTFSFLQILREIKKRTLKRPKFTLKILIVFSIMIIFYFLFFAIYWIPASAGMTMTETAETIQILLFIYIIIPALITAIILFTNPFFNFQKRRLIKKATAKMRGLKKIKVIGITGSYGKTSTKEFLYAILGQKYKVVKTTGNNNTNIGVAYTVLSKVNDEYDYFICEMGAYKIGEIAEICSIIKPKIGILTGINEQHLDLFGSIENTIKAKFELIETLPEDGMAILNGDNEYIKMEVEKWSEGFSPTIKLFRAKALAPSIKIYQDYVEFDYLTISNCHCEEERRSNPATMRKELNSGIAASSAVWRTPRNDSNIIKFKLNLLGKHYIENVLSAIIVAEYLGMNLNEIKNAIEKIEPAEFMMRKLSGPNNSVFIDDSYSANPDGVLAALDYLDEAYQDYKKIIVFPGIIELGKESDEAHKKLFNKISEICDTAYILKNAQKLHSSAETMEPTKFVFEKDFEKVADLLKNNLDEKTVVLFESRGAGVVMGKLI